MYHVFTERIHLLADVVIYHFLIAAQLGRVVASDALVPVSCIVFVESIRCEIQHTIIQRFVLQDELIRRGLLVRDRFLYFIHIHFIVQITLVDHPHIAQTEHGDGCYHPLGFQFTHVVSEQKPRTDEDDEEAAPCVGCEKMNAHLFQIGNDRRQLVCRDTVLQGLHFHRGNVRREEKFGQYGKQQGYSAGQSETDVNVLDVFFQ